jgi:hypothetical protein
MALSGLMGIGCGGGLATVPVLPLFDQTARAVPHGQTARLFGPIAMVDGSEVPQFAPGFELLPGSHTVRTCGETVEPSAYWTVTGRPGPRTFELAMKPGYTYLIKQRIVDELGGRLAVDVIAEELDQTGAYVQTLRPSSSNGDDDLQATGLGGVVGFSHPRAKPTQVESTSESGCRARPSGRLAPR